ncbi:MAG: 50S ribosomal protein L25 [Gemmatimonadales bacterium]|jgi:large subunit ribosomal protein L25|nr:50S ribosomal protein L25 [Gemmatimonadales bacterium]
MAQTVNLRATSRTTKGKGAARSLRRAGMVPAVIYGRGREPESVQVEAPVLGRALHGVSPTSTLFELTIDDRTPVKALIREIQRHPLRAENILHLDLFEVRADEKVNVEVAVHLVGTPEGVRSHGGVLDQQLYAITLRVLPADIPASVDVDVSALGIGASLHVSDLSVVNAEIVNDAGQTVCVVSAPRTEEAAPGEAPPTAEPELIRKPKAEDEGEE